MGLALCICGTLGKGTLRTYPSFRVPTSWDLAATALVLTAEAAAELIADDTDGGNSGVTIIGRASLAARGGPIINSIVYLLSKL